jgi:hypothetical protein
MTNPQIPRNVKYPQSFRLLGSKKPTPGNANIITMLTIVHQTAK